MSNSRDLFFGPFAGAKKSIRKSRVTRQVLEHIAEIETRKAYLELGYDGMYSYLTKGLGYSDGAAYRRLQAARLLLKHPAVAEKFEAGVLNLTQLADVAKLSRQAQRPATAELFLKLEAQSKSASEQIIAQEFEVPARTVTRQKTQIDHSVRFELSFTAEQFAALENARTQLSHICPDGSWPEVIVELARQYSKKFEVRKSSAKPSAAHVVDTQPAEANWAPAPRAGRRRGITPSRRRLIYLRAEGRCEHRHPQTGPRCSSRYQPQIDHIHAVARGGTNKLENLQLLCAVHNRAKGMGLQNTLDESPIWA